MERAKKEELVKCLQAELQSAGSVVLLNALSLNASDTTELRNHLRQNKVKYKVFKNTLSRIVFSDTRFKEVVGAKFLIGQVGIAWSDCQVTPAKAINDFARKNNKVKIIGGSIGRGALSSEQTIALANLPDIDTLRAKLLMLVNAPAQRILGAVQQAGGAGLLRVISEASKKGVLKE